MDRFVFKESADNSVLKYIGVAVLIFLIISGAVIFVVSKWVIPSNFIYPGTFIVLFIYFFIFIRFFRKRVVTTTIYELTPEEICRTDTKTNKKSKFRLEEIESIENDSFTFKNVEREYIRIRFKNSTECFTIQSDPDDIKCMLDFSKFKTLIFRFVKTYKKASGDQLRHAGGFSNFLIMMALPLIVVLVVLTILVFVTGKAHRATGLIPLYIGFLPIIIIGLSQWKKNRNTGK